MREGRKLFWREGSRVPSTATSTRLFGTGLWPLALREHGRTPDCRNGGKGCCFSCFRLGALGVVNANVLQQVCPLVYSACAELKPSKAGATRSDPAMFAFPILHIDKFTYTVILRLTFEQVDGAYCIEFWRYNLWSGGSGDTPLSQRRQGLLLFMRSFGRTRRRECKRFPTGMPPMFIVRAQSHNPVRQERRAMFAFPIINEHSVINDSPVLDF